MKEISELKVTINKLKNEVIELTNRVLELEKKKNITYVSDKPLRPLFEQRPPYPKDVCLRGDTVLKVENI